MTNHAADRTVASARRPLEEPAWYAIQCTPCQEGTAATGLRRAGYFATLPIDRFQVKVRRPLGRSLVQWVERPHFSGYAFLALRYTDEDLGRVRGIKGVVGIVSRPLSGEPLRIPCIVMDRILDERLVSLDDGRGTIVMSETHLHVDRELRVFLNTLGRWKCELLTQELSTQELLTQELVA